MLAQKLLTVTPTVTAAFYSLYAWGNNSIGELGLNDVVNRSSPTQIGTLSWKTISSGTDHTLAIRSDNKLFAWGDNGTFALGNPNQISQSSPSQIGTDNWLQVSAGNGFSLGIDSNKRLYGWGDNTQGQLAGGSFLVTGRDADFTTVSAGPTFNLAINEFNKLLAWGDGVNALMGLNSPSIDSDRSYPVQIGDSSWTTVAAGLNQAAAIRADGALFVWGQGTAGALGLNDTITRSSPTQLGTSSWTSVSISKENDLMAAIRSDGSLFVWGANGYGYYPTEPLYMNRSSPVQVGTSSWTSVSVGTRHIVGLVDPNDPYGWGSNNVQALGLTFNNVALAKTWNVLQNNGTISAGIDNSNKLWCWGDNTNGALGLNYTISRSFPVQVGNSSWTNIAVGLSHMIGVRSDGALFAWGLNSSGQLGDGSTITLSSPTQIGTSSWSQVSAGNSHSMATTKDDAALFVWGSSSVGQLGDGFTINRSSPVQIPASYSSWTAISTKADHSIGVSTAFNNCFFVWGSGANGRLGNGFTTNRSAPVQINGPGAITQSYVQVSAGGNFSLVQYDTRGIYSFGSNASGQLGLNIATAQSRSSPVQIGASSWISISAGASHALALNNGNITFAWGAGTLGQMGNSSNVSRSSPVQVAGSVIGNFVWAGTDVSMGGNFVWGQGGSGSLGMEGEAFSSPVALNMRHVNSPVTIGSSRPFTQLIAGKDRTFGIDPTFLNYDLWGWGDNTNGAIGDSRTFTRSTPNQVGSTKSWTSITSGYSHTVGTISNNETWAWGNNTSGQLGINIGTTTGNRSSPTQITTNGNNDFVSAGASHTVAWTDKAAAYSWGTNTSGLLGLGIATGNRSTPTQIESNYEFVPRAIGSSTWAAVAAGSSSSYGILSDNKLFSWGSVTNGASGRPTGTVTTSPILVGNSSWTTVAAGPLRGFAVRIDGGLFAWGDNTAGALGLGDTLNRSSPVQIGSSSWSTVASGTDSTHTLALRQDKTLFSWGNNLFGQLGNESTEYRSSPVQIGTSTFNSIATGKSFSMASRSNNSLFTWGYNTNGQLGHGDVSWSMVAANGNFAIGITKKGLLYAWGQNQGIPVNWNIPEMSFPVQIGTSSWTFVAVTDNEAFAIRSDGGLFSWGNGDLGQLGLGDTRSRSSPTQIGTSSWLFVGPGENHVLAVRSDGYLFAWGLNDQGRLGINVSTGNRSSPVQVGSSSWTMTKGGGSFSVAIRSDGGLFSWGYNNKGTLGIPTDNANRSSPVQLGTSSWNNITAGSTISLAIRLDKALFTWGEEGTGELGLNTNKQAKSSPTQVGTSSWIFVAASTKNGTNNYAMAIRVDNYLFAWGENSGGSNLPTNNTVTYSSPVQIGSSSWTFVNAGNEGGFGILNNNQLYIWGDFSSAGNRPYILFQNTSSPNFIPATAVPVNSPSQVGTLSYPIIAAGSNSSFGGIIL